MIVFAAIVPHPPASVRGIGNKRELKELGKTIEAMDKLRLELERTSPDTVIIISPHARLEKIAFNVNSAVSLRGGFTQFGLDLMLEFENDAEIVNALALAGEFSDFPVHLQQSYLDHGTLVPLFHLMKNIKPKIVQLSFSLLDFATHYRYGEILENICEKTDKRVAIVASGDLSHRLLPNSPAGYSPKSALFDKRLMGILRKQDFAAIQALQKESIEEAAECGLRAFVILLGALSMEKREFKLLSYEYPFGIGHLVARFL